MDKNSTRNGIAVAVRRLVRHWFWRNDCLTRRKRAKERDARELVDALWAMQFWVWDRAPWPDETSYRRWWIRSNGPNRIFVRIDWKEDHPALTSEQSYEMVYLREECAMVGIEGVLKSAIYDALRLRAEAISFSESNSKQND